MEQNTINYTRESSEHLLRLAHNKSITGSDIAGLNKEEMTALVIMMRAFNGRFDDELGRGQREEAALCMVNNPHEDNRFNIIQQAIHPGRSSRK